MKNTSTFIIENSFLTKYVGSGGAVTIPDSVSEIGDYVFEGCNNLIIHAPTGSSAVQYAKENKMHKLPEGGFCHIARK